MSKPKVAFICVHNSCRSQIAEAFGKVLAADVFESYSAGTETKPQINQDAVRLMKELYGIDMEKTQYSKLISAIPKPDIAMWLHLKKGGDIMQSHFLPAAGRTTKIISGPMQRHCFNTEWMPIICIGDRKHPWSCRI